MRRLIVTENVTVDGVMDLPAGWFDSLAEDVDQSDITPANAEHREAADAPLVGRTTFESFREFRPTQTIAPTGISDYLNQVDKYVVSGTLQDQAGRTRPSCAAISSRTYRRSRPPRAARSSRRAACRWCTP